MDPTSLVKYTNYTGVRVNWMAVEDAGKPMEKWELSYHEKPVRLVVNAKLVEIDKLSSNVLATNHKLNRVEYLLIRT